MAGLSPILQIAKEILQDAGQKGLHVKSIATQAVNQNKNMGLSADEFQKKVQSALAANLKLKSTSPTFGQVNHSTGTRKGKPKQGWYRLKIKRTKTNLPSPPKPNAPHSTGFAGKAGEYAVMSELLFWGFNTSIMTVDDGIDIVATKGNRFFLLQVKTAHQNENGKYQFSIKKSSYTRYSANNVFYVFVLRSQCKNDFIIIPHMQLEYFINTSSINISTERFSIIISYDEKKKGFILNNHASIQVFHGNFGVIK